MHRDIKADNAFFFSNGLLKLGDFGLTTHHDESKKAGNAGTPYYMAPEIHQGEHYDFKVDVWALGILLYRLTALKYPFDANNQAALVIKVS